MLDRLATDSARQTDERQATLVLLGDCIDRGDDSQRVLDLIAEAERHWPRMIYLRGNHEDALLRFLEDPIRGRGWLSWGGRQTLASFAVPAPGATADRDALWAAARALRIALGHHVARIAGTQLVFRSGNVLCAHAGIDPRRDLDKQRSSALVWGQSAFEDKPGPVGVRVVYGHYTLAAPLLSQTRVGLDTGAYHSGRLSAVRLDQGTRIFQT